MNNANAARFFSFTSRFITLGLTAAAVILATPSAQAKSGTGLGGSGVVYSVPRQIVQGNMPLTTSYTLQITSPANLVAGTTSLVTLNTSLLTAPAGISSQQALSFVTITPLQTGLIGGLVANLPLINQIASLAPVLTFTGPNQTLSVTVTVNIPDGAWAGSFGYEILTSGWTAGLVVEDPGAFINVTATRPALANGPVISINQPVDQTIYTFSPTDLPAQIPYTIIGSTQDGSPLTAMNATLMSSIDGGTSSTVDLGITPNGLGTANATATGFINITASGTYVISSTDANANGIANAQTSFTVQIVSGPPTVSIDSPDAGSTYIMSGNLVTIPFTFSGISQYSGVRSLTATLDGQPVTFTPNGYGNLTATGAGNLVITSAGDHVLAVTCTDDYGTASTNETITVTVQAPNPPPTVVINTPAPNATYTYTTGGPALTVPFTFTGSSTGGPITNLTATMDGVAVAFTYTGLNTQTANGTASLSFNATTVGNHTLAVTATNDVGTAATSEVITVVAQNPQTSTLKVAITKPVANSTYALSSNGCPLTIPDAFTSNSTATSGVTSLTVTFNGTPVSVSTSTLGKPTVTATGNLVVTAPGVYTLAVTATDQFGTATTSQNITVTAPTPTPKISIVKPCDGAQYTVGTSSCPLWVQVSVTGNTSAGSTLSTFTLTLNGQPVTYTTLSGLNTVSANGTVSLKITATGTYTLVATTTSGGVSVSDTNAFKVVAPSGCGSGYDGGWGNGFGGWNDNNCNTSWSWFGGYTSNRNCTPTPCNVNFEQSWSCGSTQTGGKTLPLCFHIQYTGSSCTNYWNNYYKNCDSDYYSSDNDSRNCWGNYGYVNCLWGNVPSSSSCLNNTWDNIGGCKYSDDTTVKVVCYEIKSNGSCGTPTVFTCNAKTNGYKISSNDQYSCNIPTAKGTHTYRYDVYYTDKNSGKQCFLGSQKFGTK